MLDLNNSWEKITPKGNFIPDARSGHACVIFQSVYLFVFGGYNDREALNDLIKFNLQSLFWEKVEISNKETETPTKRASSSMVCSDELECIYVFGGTGYNPQQLVKNNLYEFSIPKSQWRALKTTGNAPSGRYGHSMNIYKNFLVVFGGVGFSSKGNNLTPEYYNDLYLYSILDKRWILLQTNGTIPQPRHGHQGIVMGNDLFIVGGTNTTMRFGNLHKYEFLTNKWSYMNFENHKKKEKDILFKGRYCHGAVIDDDEIYIYGGRDDAVCDDILHLDMKGKTWNRKKVNGNKPEGREFFSNAYCNRKMVIFGGRKGDKRLNDLHIWNISVPKASYKDCSLRQEIWEMYKSQDNFADVTIFSSSKKEYRLHSCILKARFGSLYRNIEKDNKIFTYFDDLYLQILINYIYTGEAEISLLNQTQLIELTNILMTTELVCFLKMVFIKLMNETDGEKDLETIITIVNNLRSKHLKDKDIIVQENLNLIQKLSDWLDFRSKNFKALSKKEETLEFLKKIMSFNLDFENISFKNAQRYYEDFEKIFFDEQTSDFSIELPDKIYKVHRCILLARSNFFESALRQETMENENKQIKFNKVLISSPQIFEIILKYFYSGFHGIKKIDLNFEYFNSILQISNYLDVKSQTFNFIVEDKISEFLEEKNCIEILDIADKIGAQIIKIKAMSFIASKFQKNVLQNEENLKKLPSDLLVDLMVFYSKQHS